MYLLATHPDIQTQLREEIHAHLQGQSGAGITASLMESLPILHGVICEALRLYPGAPILLRYAVRNTFIQEQYVPRDTQIILCPWAVNRSTSLWGHDASRFNPNRWIETASDGTKKPINHGGALSNYSFLTFLQGPRRCIGENFTRAELRCLIASVIGAFEVRPAAGKEVVTVTGVVGLKPAEGVWLQIRPVSAGAGPT